MTLRDRLVYQWALRYWPDLRETWGQYREYYYHEYRKEMGNANVDSTTDLG